MIEVRSASIDEKATKDIMSYYKIDNHDEFVRYIKSLGIEHND
jgi:hypothetical protein